ncbi:MAG: tRNA (adenosine(37)-N6)-threonylcarbamoyltransferase complex dimerization subunit type 1 TsaB [Firmicutes bacterium]|jgi:tRNA threonylcarbamoyladenosine biosynthesis protein TsaB|nr:tRNA (adenosine(37)-N6)-threonylcarbamoyltransferase complex dimerization subunit type 1 TsaB [Bacillota bacterium]
MFVLGIDTTTLVCSVAVVSENMVVAEYTLQVKKTHSQRLLPLIATMLADSGLTPAELDGVAVVAGPGSFTGVRIGIVTAKALGQALGIPLCGISTLEALAAQHPWFDGLVCPILDARRRQVYTALFRGYGSLQRLAGDKAASLPAVLEKVEACGEKVLFVGDAVPVYREFISGKLGEKACLMPPESVICRAATAARLGLEMLARGQAVSWRELAPRYLRQSEAEVKYRETHGGGGTCL